MLNNKKKRKKKKMKRGKQSILFLTKFRQKLFGCHGSSIGDELPPKGSAQFIGRIEELPPKGSAQFIGRIEELPPKESAQFIGRIDELLANQCNFSDGEKCLISSQVYKNKYGTE
ncbi:hypothetical protein LNQ82_01895 [Conchiformibius steedae DSM 2580]|uniref:Uncharacterized protein n=1 Tax=Conchiformibius steedae DSM 2580 TaxID=1121352 RepID=A0AAE9HUR3_9NEIS|nr:hypothetical protein [Conchiformibius steedae]QMT33297.1 hypothetical protein H3L98_09430 [Conchiformibius steedae]URD67939.1 hypothetical protein LNQ82_01895 [Conchiformibius steedae DSM 2580]